jgi:hypothetical protein
MTVIRPGGKSWRQGNKPPWMATPSAGFFSLAAEGNVHDCHYHELNEFYLVSCGKAKILNGEIGPPEARLGHLHKSAEKAVLHPVMRKPVPPDFPSI